MKRYAFNSTRFEAMPLIAILRGHEPAVVEPATRAVIGGGFVALEITMDTPDAASRIRTAVACAGDALDVGAGTVKTVGELDRAHAAGAKFIVTPVVVPEVVSECVRRGLPVFPGAFTPSEIFQAHTLGATMVKLFPAHRLGPGYVRDLRAPLAPVRLLATGGITPESMPEYATAGAAGFGIGSPLFAPERLGAGDWNWLRAQAARFCEAWRRSSRS